jgi:hypothetical protein
MELYVGVNNSVIFCAAARFIHSFVHRFIHRRNVCILIHQFNLRMGIKYFPPLLVAVVLNITRIGDILSIRESEPQIRKQCDKYVTDLCSVRLRAVSCLYFRFDCPLTLVSRLFSCIWTDHQQSTLASSSDIVNVPSFPNS